MKKTETARENYDKMMQECTANVKPGEPLLLHVCCGPCSSSVLEKLTETFAVTLLYYNPNIAPEEEYARRLDEVRRLAAALPAADPLRLIEAGYEPEEFARAVYGLEDEPEGGERCTRCFALRLQYAAQQAAQRGFGWFATSLTLSPHKDAMRLNRIVFLA